MAKISVVINTLNEEDNLPHALASIKSLADEIVVVDMESTDKTVQIAKKFGAKVYSHKKTGYVEPARNFALSKVTNDWILILDADETIPESLSKKLLEVVKTSAVDYVRIPRKNIIFGKWIEHSRWWPDYNIRFFKKNSVSWDDHIHSVPVTQGRAIDLPSEEGLAIVHNNYSSVSQYIERMNRYTSIQATSLIKQGYEFDWVDVIRKPIGEFVSRFLAADGYKDGLHGLGLALLQALSEATLYLKVWEKEKFKEHKLSEDEVEGEIARGEAEIEHWLIQTRLRNPGPFRRLLGKLLK